MLLALLERLHEVKIILYVILILLFYSSMKHAESGETLVSSTTKTKNQ